MTKLSVALGLARFAWGVRRFCREVETVPHALETVRARLRDREGRLLASLASTVFGRPRSPYTKLLRAAGCEPGDVERLVRTEGVDGALERLRVAGVYVSFEEFKGLVPAVRGSQRFEFDPTDFDNPALTPHLSLTTGGSRARPTRILIDLDYLAELTPSWAAFYESHGWMDRETIFVTAFYPTIVNRYLRCARIGKPYDRWFVTARGGSSAYALGTRWIHWTARRAAGSPAPSTVALDRLDPVVAVLAEGAARGKAACVHTSPTTAARLAVLATRLGRSLAGVAFCFAGEPYTDARRQSIEAAGAHGVPFYGSAETATVGAQCPRPLATDTVHVFTDLYAAVPDPRPLVDGRRVDGILHTGLLRAGPKILLNTDLGDVGRLERQPCDCLLGQLGYDTHLSEIRTFQKLTGDGTTFLASDLYPVLEDVLPRRFGGATSDYQLLELQDAQGVSCYQLLVSPDVGPLSETDLVATFFEALTALRPAYGIMVDQWRRGGFLQVRRERPRVSARGKTPPVYTLEMGGSGRPPSPPGGSRRPGKAVAPLEDTP